MDKSLFKHSLSVDYLENCHGIKFDLCRVHELSAFIRPRRASPTIDISCDQIITSASRRTSWNVSTASKKDLVNYQISHICLVHSLKHQYCLFFLYSWKRAGQGSSSPNTRRMGKTTENCWLLLREDLRKTHTPGLSFHMHVVPAHPELLS